MVQADLGHHLDCHRLVALVIEEAGGPTFRVIANDALERNHRSVFGTLQPFRDSGGFDRAAREREKVPARVLPPDAYTALNRR